MQLLPFQHVFYDNAQAEFSKDQRPQYSGINILLFITRKVGGNPRARLAG